MSKFLELEGGYLVIGLFFVVVAFFVGTRPFVGGGKAWKKTVPFTLFGITGFILVHYFVTTTRMDDVKTRFTKGGAVICESRAIRNVAQSVTIDPNNKSENWTLEGDIFKSPEYERGFHSARCLEYFYPNEEEAKKATP